MTKERAVRLVVLLVVGVIYIHFSAFMARYYYAIEYNDSRTFVERVLSEPIEKAIQIFPENKEMTSTTKVNEGQLFFVFFFAWPFLLAFALLYWLIMFALALLLCVFFSVGLLLSYLLKFLVFVFTSYKIF